MKDYVKWVKDYVKPRHLYFASTHFMPLVSFCILLKFWEGIKKDNLSMKRIRKLVKN